MSNQQNLTLNIEKLLNLYMSKKEDSIISQIRQVIVDYSENYLTADIFKIIFKKLDGESFKKIILDWRDVSDKNYEPKFFQIGFSTYVNNLIDKDNLKELIQLSESYSLNLINIDIIKKIINTKKEDNILSLDNPCLQYIKNQNLNWDKIFDGIKDTVKNDFFSLMLNKEDANILQEMIGKKEFPQWLKDTSLLISVQNLNLTNIQYWLEKGADPQLQSLQKNTFILNNKVILPDTKVQGSYIANASESRQLIVKHLPSYFKNDSYLYWSNWVDIMLSSKNKFINNEIGLYMFNEDIKPTDPKKYSKYAQCLITLPIEKFDILIKQYHSQNILNNNFKVQLYKYVVLNNKDQHLGILFENSIDSKPYIKSTICKNIQEDKIENIKYTNDVVKLNNQVINFDLYNKLTDRFAEKQTEVKKKYKI